MALTKFAVLFCYRRFSFGTYIRWGIRVMMLYIIVWWVVFMLCELLVCRPIKTQWEPTTPGATCWDATIAHRLESIRVSLLARETYF